MQSIVTKNKRGEVTNTITGQKKLQEETANFLGKILAYKKYRNNRARHMELPLNTAAQEAKKVTEKEREEMDET